MAAHRLDPHYPMVALRLDPHYPMAALRLDPHYPTVALRLDPHYPTVALRHCQRIAPETVYVLALTALQYAPAYRASMVAVPTDLTVQTVPALTTDVRH